MADGLGALPRGWRLLFAVELPLVAGTLLYWLAAPDDYLETAIGVSSPGAPERLLLRLYAGTVGALVFGFYAWLLAQRRLHLPSFYAFQWALAAGDLAIIAASLGYWASAGGRAALALQIAMAALWGALRVAFLLTRRRAG
jgi:hypothetical protein